LWIGIAGYFGGKTITQGLINVGNKASDYFGF
jgi:hypothetical protein